MSGELVRFGVAMDSELLARFDELIARRGYATRSEALRDLVRADLASAHVEGGGPAAATLTLVYDHHVRELTEKLTAMQHELGESVVSVLHVHLDHDHCLEVIVLKGSSERIRGAADRLIATKGVEHGRLVLTALPSAEHGLHHAERAGPPDTEGTAHAHARHHGHDHGHEDGHDPAHAHTSPRGRIKPASTSRRGPKR